uniref:Uncharacterized protein n=1 Tax=Cannabis sativa TaxID=3483 RepID=A0A803QZF0_CANSA
MLIKEKLKWIIMIILKAAQTRFIVIINRWTFGIECISLEDTTLWHNLAKWSRKMEISPGC